MEKQQQELQQGTASATAATQTTSLSEARGHRVIKLKWGELRDREFMASLSKLFAQPMGFEMGQRFVLLGRKIKEQQKMLDETHEKLLKQFGVPDEKRKGFYNIPEDKREGYAAEMKLLDEHTFEVKIRKFDAEAISKLIQLSPQDLMFLDPILLPVDTVEEQDTKKSEAQPGQH